MGEVTEVLTEKDIDTSVSKLFFIRVAYSEDAPRNLPRALVVKTPSASAPAASPGGELREVDFYRRIGPAMATVPLVRCLAALDSTDDEPQVLVLENLRDTHSNPPWPLPPFRSQCESAIDTLVAVHAHWWNSPELGRSVGSLHTEQSLTEMVQSIATHLPAFTDALGDRLTARARDIYRRVFASSLRPWLRLTDTRGLTLAHGDAHTWNFLFPRTGAGPALLIDWQLWHLDAGARDLAFMMALHWYPSRRSELEQPLLRHYHDGLVERGVGDYAFDELLLDYRRCVVRNLTIPVLFWSRGMQPEGWWHRLECAIAAYMDLNCDEVL